MGMQRQGKEKTCGIGSDNLQQSSLSDLFFRPKVWAQSKVTSRMIMEMTGPVVSDRHVPRQDK